MPAHGFFASLRRLKFLCLLASVGSTTTATMASWSSAAPPPSGCTDISAVPVQYTITFGAAIQGIFTNFSGMNSGCVDCHVAPDEGPAGNLSLVDGFSYVALIDHRSDENPRLTYVIPNHPEQSLLFQKVNCDLPPVGSRMPFNGSLSVEQQALIYDWIAAGAPVGTTDGIFRNAFDYRGFQQ
jgi:hypothetical protein